MSETVTFFCPRLDDGTPAGDDNPAALVAVPRAFAMACETYKHVAEDMGDATDATSFPMDERATPAVLRAVIDAVAWLEGKDITLPAVAEPHAAKVAAWEALAPWFETCPQASIVPGYNCANYLAHPTAMRLYCLRLAYELTCLTPDEVREFLQVPGQPAKRVRIEG